MQFLEDLGVTYVVVATKCDLLKSEDMLTSLHTLNAALNLPPGQPIPMSSISGMGKRDLWNVIRLTLLGQENLPAVPQDEDNDSARLDQGNTERLNVEL